MKRLTGITALGLALALPSGILTSAASASPPNLSARLLSIGQMPTGWSVDNSAGGGGVGCLANTLEPKGVKQTAVAAVDFEDNGNVPALEEKLATFTNTKTAYSKIVANLAGCKQVRGSSGGDKVTGTVGQMSLPRYGDASEAFAVSLSTQGTTFGEDLVVIRKGNFILGIAEIDVPPVDVSQLQGFVVMAIRKLG